MHIVLIGDVGWRDFYHLGDEAMTEFAIEALRRRNIDQITLVGGNPATTSNRYGVESVGRIGFRGGPRDRQFNNSRYEAVVEAAQGRGSRLPNGDSAKAIIDAVRDSDAVLIAGGGNLNSFFPHHIFERAALARIAACLGKPLGLSSQTLGPLIRDVDRDYVGSILRSAVAIGARERSTLSLATSMYEPTGVVAATMDDAFGVVGDSTDRAHVDEYRVGRYIVASFAERPSTPIISNDEYHHLIASTMVELADLYEARVLLVPHAGTLEENEQTRDEISNATIAKYASDSRVSATRMLTAREVAALTEDASLVIGTRYHPGIFAARAGVPTISLAPSMYSSVRMRGAANNIGMADYVLGLETWRSGGVVRAASELLEEDEAVRKHMCSVRDLRLSELERWWDDLLCYLKGNRAYVGRKYLASVESFRSPGDWATAAGDLLDATERYDRERITQKWRIDELVRTVHSLRTSLAEVETHVEPMGDQSSEAARPSSYQDGGKLSRGMRRVVRKARKAVR